MSKWNFIIIFVMLAVLAGGGYWYWQANIKIPPEIPPEIQDEIDAST